MLGIGNRVFTAFGLVAFLIAGTGCKFDEKPCVSDVEESVALTPVKGQRHLLMAVEEHAFLADSSIVWDDIELELTIAGQKEMKTSLGLSFNGFKFNRKDGRRALENFDYNKRKNIAFGKFKLHKMYLNGGEPFHAFLARIKKNKGVLEVHVLGKSLDITAAKITFKGKSYAKCPDTSPTPVPTPAPEAPATQIDSTDPLKSPTASTSISIYFSSTTEGNAFWCSLDNAEPEKCSSPISYSSLAAGTHTFKVYAKNPQGMADNTPAIYTWRVDNVAPAVTITNSSSLPLLTNSREVHFDFAADEDDSTFLCSLDGAEPVACVSPQVYQALGEGAHVFSVNAKDAAGNIGKVPATFRWSVDVTAPVASFVDIIPGEAVTASETKSFTFTADETASFECSLDRGTFAACVAPLEVTGMSEGPHWFEVRATDAAGNIGLVASYSWVVDRTAPVLSLGSISPQAGLTNAKSLSAEFAASEIADLFCSFDGAEAAVCQSPFVNPDVAEGEHSLVVTAIDGAGNRSAPLELLWTMDFTAPVISFAEILPSASANLNAESIEMGVNAPEGSALFASVNGAEAVSFESPLRLQALGEGSYSVAVTAVDAAGNASVPLIHEFVLDRTAPVLTLTPANLANPSNADSNSFELSSSEAGVFECALDSAGFESCGALKEISGLIDGEHLLQARALDLAGNVSSVVEYRWVVDTMAPSTSVLGQSQEDSATMTLSSSESGGSFLCSLDGAAFAPCAETISYSGLSLGSHSFLAKAVDAAGNQDPVGASYQFVVIKPIQTLITSVTPGENPTNKSSLTLTFVANQPNATFLCSLDGGSFNSCLSPRTYSGLGDGSHNVVVKAIDAFGNVDVVGASYSWVVDRSAPVVSGLSLTATSNSIVVSWTTNEPATSRVIYGVGATLNQGTVESTSFGTTHKMTLVGLSSNTTYSIQVSGRDALANVYTSSTRTVKTSR